MTTSARPAASAPPLHPVTTGGAAAPPAPPRPPRSRRDRSAWVFLLPWLIGFAGLTVGPMIASLYFSFTDYNLLGAPEWVGLANYREMFTDDPNYLQSVRVTVLFVVLSVPLKLAVGLAVAMLLNTKLRGMSFYRSVFYVPSLLGGSVAVAILWKQLFGADGAVNQGLLAFGIVGPNWVAEPDYSLYTIVLLGIWQFGSPMVIFLAGLRQIPRELIEAAEVDGAGRLRRFVSITLPLLSPIIFFNFVMQIIGSFQTFSQAYVISGGTGAPAGSTLFYGLYLYIKAFTQLEMGFAAAMAWVLLVVVALITGLNFLLSRYWVFYQDEGR